MIDLSAPGCGARPLALSSRAAASVRPAPTFSEAITDLYTQPVHAAWQRALMAQRKPYEALEPDVCINLPAQCELPYTRQCALFTNSRIGTTRLLNG